jgi:hypothetical protein
MAYASKWAHDFNEVLASARQVIAVGRDGGFRVRLP